METADPLVGKAPDPDLITGISERVLHTKGILDMHDLLVHDYGPGHVMVSLHAEIPSDLSLIKAHEIIDRLESQIDREFGVTSLIHIDPVDVHDHEAINLRSGVLIYLKAMDPDAGLHDFRILRGGDKPVISSSSPSSKMNFRDIAPSYGSTAADRQLSQILLNKIRI